MLESGSAGDDSRKPPAYRIMTIDDAGNVRSNLPLPVQTDDDARAAAAFIASGIESGLFAELCDGLRFIEQFGGPSDKVGT